MSRRQELQQELAALDAVDAQKKALRLEAHLAGLDEQGRFDLLDYLTRWAKARPGHRPDCNCGECD